MQEIALRIITAISLALFFSSVIMYAPGWLFIVIVLGLLAWMLVAEWPKLMPIRSPYFEFITIFYPILPTMLIILLHINTGPSTTVYLISAVALHDSVSYFIGKSWGSTKILPSVSPGKTVEGFLGGMYATLLFNIYFLYNDSAELWFIIVFTIGLCILAFAGDIFESLLKRRAGLKDSGTILPGHGGLFDRIDGLLFAILLVYPYQYYLHTILTK